MRFEEYRLDEQLKRNIQRLGYTRPTDIQYKSIPPILQNQDVLAIAQTGTGKTAAFAIPVIHRILARKNPGLECLVMVPTHELADQIAGVFKDLVLETDLNVLALYGGVDQSSQIESLKSGVNILVTTPGRMFDLHHQGYIDFSNIKWLILDEADHMLDLGFLKDIRDVVRKLPQKRQTLFFSATINPKIKKLAYSVVNNPIRIQISPKNPVAKMIEHSVMHIAQDEKRFFLERLYRENESKKIVVFTRTKVRTERVHQAMKRMEIESHFLHSGVSQDERTDVLRKFRKGEFNMLITTDVTARGIDIPNVEIVVNYDLPDKPDQYVHRVGRTGRSGKKGFAVSFVSNNEEELLHEINTYLGSPIHEIIIDRDVYQETIDFTRESSTDWKSLMKEEEQRTKVKKQTKKKK